MDPFSSFLQDYGIFAGITAYIVYWFTNRYTKKLDELIASNREVINEIRELRNDIKDVIVTCVTSCQNGTKAGLIAKDLQRNTK